MNDNRSMVGVAFEPHREVRVAILGAGFRGRTLLGLLRQIPEVRIRAVADRWPEALAQVEADWQGSDKPLPALVQGDGDAVTSLIERDDIDLVVVATPWDTHAELAVRALDAGKHVAVEVPLAQTLSDLWDVVGASERAQRHCVLLENCCYGSIELQVLRMVRAGAFGALLHAEAGYLHDVREQALTTHAWWLRELRNRNGNLYPTHGLGPVASYLGIHRGDRFTRMASFSSAAIGMAEFEAAYRDSEEQVFLCGDVNTSILQTHRGRTVTLQFQVVGPRPYDRLNNLVGTRGALRGSVPEVHLSPQPITGLPDLGVDDWVDLSCYSTFNHPLWENREELRRKDPHGGMDFLMLSRLIGAMVSGTTPDIDVYDGAAWSAPGPLSEVSVASGTVVEFPDFTDGHWHQDRPGIP